MKSTSFVSVFVIRPAPAGWEFLQILRVPGRYMEGTWQLVSGGIEENEPAWRSPPRELIRRNRPDPDRVLSLGQHQHVLSPPHRQRLPRNSVLRHCTRRCARDIESRTPQISLDSAGSDRGKPRLAGTKNYMPRSHFRNHRQRREQSILSDKYLRRGPQKGKTTHSDRLRRPGQDLNDDDGASDVVKNKHCSSFLLDASSNFCRFNPATPFILGVHRARRTARRRRLFS